jgi:general secretion pathway protein G
MNPALKIILFVAAALCLLVCGVIGLAGWFVKDNVERFRATADVEQTKAQMRAVEAAIATYRLQRGELPPTLDALVGPDGTLDTEQVPLDAWGFPLRYEPGADGKTYELASFGSDGLEGGEGDAADIDRQGLQGR